MRVLHGAALITWLGEHHDYSTPLTADILQGLEPDRSLYTCIYIDELFVMKTFIPILKNVWFDPDLEIEPAIFRTTNGRYATEPPRPVRSTVEGLCLEEIIILSFSGTFIYSRNSNY